LDQLLPTILIIEDDDDVRDTISNMLWEAIAIIEEKPFDLVVADIQLPGGLNGLELARHLRLRRPELKCLFISGSAEPVVCDPRLDDFVAKPFRSSELLGCVWKVLRGNNPNPRLNIARLN
jgi:CheY-like chemotaxis protein